MKEGLSLNEQYNTGNAVSSIHDEYSEKCGVKRASRKYKLIKPYTLCHTARLNAVIVKITISYIPATVFLLVLDLNQQ